MAICQTGLGLEKSPCLHGLTDGSSGRVSKSLRIYNVFLISFTISSVNSASAYLGIFPALQVLWAFYCVNPVVCLLSVVSNAGRLMGTKQQNVKCSVLSITAV